MKKTMLELLSKNKEKMSQKEFDELFNINEEEIATFLKKIGSERTSYISAEKIEEGLDTKYIGNQIYCFHEVDSTNTVAKFLAEFGAEEGTVVISELQTKGRGRLGKKWESPVGGIWLTIILRPDISPSKASFLTLATGVAVAKTLRKMNIDARIKWPNDILINKKKVSGILTEANAKFSSVDYVVVGVGIDSNLDTNILSGDVRERMISLSQELGKHIEETDIISMFLNEFEEIYNLFKEEKFKTILYDWRRMSETIGSYVKINQPLGKVLKGYAVGINKNGALIIEKDNGDLKKIISGECIIRNDK
ncbi:bifunctional ligase/repressor BirA [Methanobrevibacter cuticularis]|uniref:Bifunctional ligase/repressor BirA n=1 Tax=Methanobrevibacter cuticularis TaxID=47311 RepID=A0A166FL13_9EURY|nr:biotin--[acetyl-CoA-carboxylase] ligase [Methanobrevibacter cuticularis]KZX17784.1 bifunctional ligase/repressor BirA [Methanobrevibacter cuticularis]